MGDEFDQYKRQPDAAGANDDEFAQYKRDTHGTRPAAFNYNANTESELQHTAPGTDTDLASRGRQLPPSRALISGPQIMDNSLNLFSGGLMPKVPLYEAARLKGNQREAQGKARGLPGMATDAADFMSSQTTPENLGLMTLGAASGVPEVGLLTKPVMAGAGAIYAGEGVKDIHDAFTDPTLDTPDRTRKGLFGGAALTGGMAGIGEVTPGPQKLGPFPTPFGKLEGTGLGGAWRGTFNRGMDVSKPNEPFTPRELLDYARNHDINLDLADATGNRGLPKMAKHVTMHGLAGSGPFDANLEHNVGALDRTGTDFLDNLSPHSGEQAGGRIQNALKLDYETRKAGASADFEDLDKRIGGASINGAPTVEAAAQKIVGDMKPYYDLHPELVPKQAWGIINDLANRQKVQVAPNPQARGLQWKSQPFTWSELHQLRSDLMDIYRNNPDLVKSRADSWLQQMVKVIDDTMTGAASKLTPRDQAQFRQANQEWETLKSTYDNPQHPLYHAIRAQMPSQVTGMLLNNRTPEFARQMHTALGPEFGGLQRAAAENVLGHDRTGAGYDFKGMPGRLSRLSPEYVADMFGAINGRDLRLMSRTGMTVSRDINPSGTAKVGQKVGEASGLGAAGTAAVMGHPLPLAIAGTGMALERGVAKAMNSPRVVDFLTDPQRGPRFNRGVMIAGPAANQAEEIPQSALDLVRGAWRRRDGMSAP